MEYVEGETLAARLKRGAMSFGAVLETAGQVCDALAATHAKGVVHPIV